MEKSKSVSSSQVVMTQLVLPSHTNALDTVFGGTVMSWIDISAAIAAQRHAGKNVVTASIDRLSFIAPIKKGWVVNLKASVNFASRTSMEVGVRVDAENPNTSEMFHTASAYLTFVAIGSDGKPSPIPAIVPEDDTEKRRFDAAIRRRQARLNDKAST
ncbi:acyl-CoA thioesterase [Pseudobdellovibrio exovorus]|uniref:Acyl-CoA thioester hydrolase n=1 Tax=Pseudobdellovibrio exovorus JSS TaxID=1184267 RepID=M4VB93_9BACT|nr:acyl-CoA thioesterase [Pseudobdellovibrio exovorus]AGH95296.1 Acyl-CoA thioester hydrolase [Pseudobdellovibrio exovorus JSS]